VTNKKIALLYPVEFLDSVPCILSLIQKLSHSGFAVDIFIKDAGDDNINTIFHQKNINIFRYNSVKKSYFQGYDTLSYLIYIFKNSINKDYDLIFGVDPAGGFCALILSMLKRVNFIYISLELILTSDKNLMFRGYKKIERMLVKKCLKIIIQDEYRSDLMRIDYDLPSDIFIYLPNSPTGCGFKNQSKWAHEKFNIPYDKKIILYMGSWTQAFQVEELLLLAKSLPDNLILLVQSRRNVAPSFFPDNSGLKNSIIFINRVLPYSDLNRLLSSVDVGIAFYDDMYSMNIKYVGKSSGKISQYLSAGIPIVVNCLPYWSYSVGKYNSGISISSFSELLPAILRIVDGVDYSLGAIKHFNEDLSFDNQYKALEHLIISS
jgi:hypothetical protein